MRDSLLRFSVDRRRQSTYILSVSPRLETICKRFRDAVVITLCRNKGEASFLSSAQMRRTSTQGVCHEDRTWNDRRRDRDSADGDDGLRPYATDICLAAGAAKSRRDQNGWLDVVGARAHAPLRRRGGQAGAGRPARIKPPSRAGLMWEAGRSTWLAWAWASPSSFLRWTRASRGPRRWPRPGPFRRAPGCATTPSSRDHVSRAISETVSAGRKPRSALRS